MGSEANAKARTQIVKLDRALKIAEAWVSKMSGPDKEDVVNQEFEARPSRLGLGAKVNRHCEVDDLMDPVKTKILKKLGVGKNNPLKNGEYTEKSTAETSSNTSDDDETESRVNVFAKKRPATIAIIPPERRKKK